MLDQSRWEAHLAWTIAGAAAASPEMDSAIWTVSGKPLPETLSAAVQLRSSWPGAAGSALVNAKRVSIFHETKNDSRAPKVELA